MVDGGLASTDKPTPTLKSDHSQQLQLGYTVRPITVSLIVEGSNREAVLAQLFLQIIEGSLLGRTEVPPVPAEGVVVRGGEGCGHGVARRGTRCDGMGWDGMGEWVYVFLLPVWFWDCERLGWTVEVNVCL